MKKKTIISCFAIVVTFLLFTNPVKLYALNYTISFTGSGASTTIDNVIVQNLTKGTTVTVPTGNVLNLTDVATSVVNINTIVENISVYPNPMQEKSTISFFVKSAGIAQINIFSIEGKKIIDVSRSLSQGNNSFQLSIPKGVYTIQVQGNGFSYNVKAISHINSDCKAQIVFSGNENQITRKPQKSKSAVTTMLYSSGDQLLYKGISGNYCTIVTDKPTESKTTNFEFVECKDADNNYYSVVKIGAQIWMAENLKTTKFLTGENISNITDGSEFAGTSSAAYCDFNNIVANGSKYGHLYNGYAVIDSRKIAPLGWHISRNEDWSILEHYLSQNGYNYDGTITGNKYAKSLAATTDWETNGEVGTVGNDLTKNNSTGFTATPGNLRNSGSFNSAGGNWWSSTEIKVENINYLWYRNLNSYWNFQYSYYYLKSNGLSVRCVKNETPILTTTGLKLTSTTTAISGGEITNDGGAPVTERGVCWSVNHNPTIADNITNNGLGNGVFSSNLTNLSVGTNYYVRAYATNEVGTSYGDELHFLKIGDTYSGGIIFYLDATQQHGLVCAPTDQSSGTLWSVSNFKSNATGTAIGTGLSNTNTLVSLQGSTGYAAKLCYDLILNGYENWFLPSKDELSLMITNLKTYNSGNLTNSAYWCSTEYNNSYAWCIYIDNSSIYSSKNTSYAVRAVRTF